MLAASNQRGGMPGRGGAERFRTFGERLCFAFACADRVHAGWLLQDFPDAVKAGSGEPFGPVVLSERAS